MRRGRISYSKVRAITRIATPETEDALLDVARAGTAAHVERLVRAWRRVDRTADAAREDARHRHASRHLETWVDDDGMVVIRGRLAPEVGAVVRRALEAAAERIHQDTRRSDAETEPDDRPTAGQRRADALGLVAECALAADLAPGTAGDRYQVVLHVDTATNEATLGDADADVDGVYVSAETSRRLSCDASRVVIRHGEDGLPLDVGRKTRTIPPAIRRALTARDRRCRFPGCESTHCDAHHITHWADGGATKLDNLLLLCRFHHRAVHEDGLKVTLEPNGEATFVRPEGAALPAVPPPFAGWDGAAALAWLDERLDQADSTIDPHTATPAWRGERFDLPWAIDLLWRPSVRVPGHPGCSTRSRTSR